MALGMAPLAVTLLFVGQTPVRGDKEFELPIAFSKKEPTFDDLKAMENHVVALTKKIMPATVGIRIFQSSGSGVIIDAEGHVLTAAHVSGDPGRKCTIILNDGRELEGKTLGANRAIDGGMIQITSKKYEFPHLEMGRSAGLKKGDWCLTLGHPGGYQKGRTPPLRHARILEVNPNFLRTECYLVGGDSGGPLFDMTGKVIGIHSRIGTPITANIHVPVDPYRDHFERLAKAEVWGVNNFGGFAEAYLGATIAKDDRICKVQTVIPKSPAESVGMQANDVITRFDNQRVGGSESFARLLSSKSPGDEVDIVMRRGEESLSVHVILTRSPKGGGKFKN
jgi:serine protease Do